MSTNKKSLFISLEGIDGCGKSTICKLFEKYLSSHKIDHIFSREPGSKFNPLCEEIRRILLETKHNIDPITESILFAASRSANVQEAVIKNKDLGKVIVFDRYIDSSLVYQGIWRNIGVNEIYTLNMYATAHTLPDITFLIDIEPSDAIQRIQKSQRKQDRLDKEVLEGYQTLYLGYHFLAKKFNDRYVVIDGTQTPEKILENMILAINKHLKKGNYFIDEI